MRFVAAHELDLHGEGEIELSGPDLSAIVKYIHRIDATLRELRWRIEKARKERKCTTCLGSGRLSPEGGKEEECWDCGGSGEGMPNGRD